VSRKLWFVAWVFALGLSERSIGQHGHGWISTPINFVSFVAVLTIFDRAARPQKERM
jgi:hypothetical protein